MSHRTIIALLVLVALAQAADTVTCVATLAVAPLDYEANALARAIGVIPFAGVKCVALVVMLVGVDYALRTDWPWLQVSAVAVPVTIGVAGAVANLVVLLAVLAA